MESQILEMQARLEMSERSNQTKSLEIQYLRERLEKEESDRVTLNELREKLREEKRYLTERLVVLVDDSIELSKKESALYDHFEKERSALYDHFEKVKEDIEVDLTARENALKADRQEFEAEREEFEAYIAEREKRFEAEHQEFTAYVEKLLNPRP